MSFLSRLITPTNVPRDRKDGNKMNLQYINLRKYYCTAKSHSPKVSCVTMRFPAFTSLILSLLLTASHAQDAATVCVSDPTSASPPMVRPLLMRNGNVVDVEPSASDEIKVSDVLGCCGTTSTDTTCQDSRYKPVVIGQMVQMTEDQAMAVLEAAKEAWNGGAGVWPQMSLGERIQAVEDFIVELMSSRDAIIQVLMWEIGKNKLDATAEFDRTIQFIQTMIAEIHQDPEFNSDWETIGATRAFVRRTAIGIIMCLGPYNYPLNETWAMAFAALLAGNVLVLKIPTVGGLCHLLTSKFCLSRVYLSVYNHQPFCYMYGIERKANIFPFSGCLFQGVASGNHSFHLWIGPCHHASSHEIGTHRWSGFHWWIQGCR